MKILLIDDNSKFLSVFRESLPTYVVKETTIDFYTKADDEIYNKNYDIVFLDVLLGEKESFNFGEKIKLFSPDTVLVFISEYDHFVYKGLRQGMFFFIRKSNIKEDLDDFFRKYENIKQKQEETIVIKVGREEILIPQYKIICIESYRNSLIINTCDEKYKTYSSLTKVYPTLNDQKFYRFNAHIIINLEDVEEIEKYYIVLTGNRHVRFTRDSRKPFMDAYLKYKGRKLWNC